ncbi:MAG: hypothetical protein BWZ03_00423 [bacterium ADurb.BinA186]|nr:MAG: hypothetical protein BWZ03_00423 [bacterium ADurb.BinA186]
MKLNKIIAILLAPVGLLTLVAGFYFFVNTQSAPVVIRWIFVSLMTLDAILYFVASWAIFRKIRWFYYPAIFLLAINMIALVFDDVGLVDLVVGFYNAILIVLVLVFLKNENGQKRK